MQEGHVERINQLMEALIMRLETDVRKLPPDQLEHITNAICSVFSFKEAMTNVEDRTRLEERAIRQFMRFMGDQGGMPPQGGIKLP